MRAYDKGVIICMRLAPI